MTCVKGPSIKATTSRSKVLLSKTINLSAIVNAMALWDRLEWVTLSAGCCLVTGTNASFYGSDSSFRPTQKLDCRQQPAGAARHEELGSLQVSDIFWLFNRHLTKLSTVVWKKAKRLQIHIHTHMATWITCKQFNFGSYYSKTTHWHLEQRQLILVWLNSVSNLSFCSSIRRTISCCFATHWKETSTWRSRENTDYITTAM